jgi:hypothetical protein
VSSQSLEAIALGALLLLAGVIGWAWRGEKDQQELLVANASVATCSSAAGASAAALTTTQATLKNMRERHDTALADANRALAERSTQIQALNQVATDRATHIVQSPHDDPNCKALADLPICAAVADQLWPVRTQAHAGDHAARSH